MSADRTSVVICAYTLERWNDLVHAVRSLDQQTCPPMEVIVVADGNPPLAERARAELPGVKVIENLGEPGLSAARNAGVNAARGDIVAFLDDDAEAAPDWLGALTAPYSDPNVVAVGGRVVANWGAGRPGWMPPAFDWVVGCTYEGHPTVASAIRNPIGANMSLRRHVVAEVGGFRSSVGRVGAEPTGCEETELCIRVHQKMPNAVVQYEPEAVVFHKVPSSRGTWAYFRARCIAEGRSKAKVSGSVGSHDALSAERDYVRRALPRSVARDLRAGFAGDRDGALRAGATVAGALLTACGYVREMVRRRRGVVATRPGVDTVDDHATVVIATHNRTDSLRRCLRSVLGSQGVDFEVVVVDNAPASDATATMVAAEFGDDSRVQLVREDRPGLGRAHNRGLECARGDIVVFTDDDVIVDRQWLVRLGDVFRADPQVGCVTGRIAPLELATPTQRWLEAYAGYGKGTERRSYDLGPNRPADALFPYTAGAFGSGANMAFRTSVLRSIGGFDPLLGAGTPTRGGDDLAAFFDVVTAGHRLVYEPSAVVWHRHHRTYESLRRGMFGYGAGLSAYLAKTVIDQPASGLDVIRRIPAGCRHALHPMSPKNTRTPPDFPRQLKRLERAGMLAGPLLYARSRVGART